MLQISIRLLLFTSSAKIKKPFQFFLEEFSLAQFFSEDDEIEYFLEDAKEVYKS
ncbi:hypothetical protein [Pseudanabaena sp. SR411]|uniref:hypothetical protein n=1 Tax=Pseudanabaena sp. SR411 TaxID=1980935 RepID=UPI0015952212|nr:hypothetical protein [Pseudanabaena sp. SR411]